MPLFDALLIVVILMTAYMGPMVLRRMGSGQRLYGWMLIGDLALAIAALGSRRSQGESAAGDLLGTIAIGGGVCLVLVPPFLRNLARRALLTDRLRLARALVDARELLQPGMGARQESELISTILEVRSGQVESAVERLRERRDRTQEPGARRPLDERIVMTYLYARRWDEAVVWFEANIEAPLVRVPPQLAVEMVRAYCERGELLKAALLVEQLEGSRTPAEPIWTLLIHRARLVFLAFAGRTAAVDAIVAPGGPLGTMPEAARCFWTGMARLKAGDRGGARSSLERAAALAGRDERSREQAEATLSRVDDPGMAGPHAMPEPVNVLADRLSQLAADAPSAAEGEEAGSGRAARRPPHEAGWRDVPVTSALLAANILAAVAMAAATGQTADLGALIEFGANAKSLTSAGEWWRLVSSMFLHVGLIHLALNMYGLWLLGRLVEQFLGRTRMLVVYVAAGVGGAAASLVFTGPVTSAGASGAIFGLLGAAVAELAIHRKKYPRRWSGMLLGNLVFLAVANVAIGLMYPMIDQSAHLGGLAAGAALGALLSRNLAIAERRWMRSLVSALGAAACAALAYGAYGAATSDLAATLASTPRIQREVGGLRLRVPALWVGDADQVGDPSLMVTIQLARRVSAGERREVDQLVEQGREQVRVEWSRDEELAAVRAAEDTGLALPAPWRSKELVFEVGGSATGKQVFRVAVLARATPGEIWFGKIEYPALLGDDLGPTIADLLSSAEPVGPIPEPAR